MILLALSFALTAVEWATVGNAAVALLALFLSGVALWNQRRRPLIEGQVVLDGTLQSLAISVRNGGTSSAQAPFFFIQKGDYYCVSHAGPGFLDGGEGRYVVTDISLAAIEGTPPALGVVGALDRKGNALVWKLGGGRRKKVRRTRFGRPQGRTFLDHFRRFHPNVKLGTQAAKVDDQPLQGR